MHNIHAPALGRPGRYRGRLTMQGPRFPAPHPTKFTDAEVRILLFPGVDGGLADPQLPSEVADWGPTLSLPNGRDNLLFGES